MSTNCWSSGCTWSTSWWGRTSRSARRPPGTADPAQGGRAAGIRGGIGVPGRRAAQSETVTFSSTYIRACVDAGDVVAAAEALGRPHRVEGVVVRGDGRGSGMGYPTANVAPPMHSAIPADGVYAGWFTVLGHGPGAGKVLSGERYPAAVRSAPTRLSRAAPAPSRRMSWTPRPTCTASMSPSTSSPASAGRRSSSRWTSSSRRMGRDIR